MRAALYARVSTRDKQNPEMQLNELRSYAERRGWDLAGEYLDLGISGAQAGRPEMDRLLADCRRRAVDAVVVFRFDRFARSVRHLVDALEEFRALGIEFVSLHENVDTTTPIGRFSFHIFAALAEFERELIRERVRSGLANARAQGTRSGKPIGRPRAAVDASTVARLRAQGRSWRAIATEMGVGVPTLFRAVQRAVGGYESLPPAMPVSG